MNNVSWVIYGFMSGNMLFQNFVFLPFSLMLLTIFLIMKREYANIVYNNVIIINYSWWIRQQNADTVFNCSCCIMALFLWVPPLMNIWKLKKEKEEKFSDKRLIGGNLIIALIYIILFIREKMWSLVLISMTKMALLGIEYRNLNKIKLIKLMEKKSQ